jgi:hypothetical protein
MHSTRTAPFGARALHLFVNGRVDCGPGCDPHARTGPRATAPPVAPQGAPPVPVPPPADPAARTQRREPVPGLAGSRVPASPAPLLTAPLLAAPLPVVPGGAVVRLTDLRACVDAARATATPLGDAKQTSEAAEVAALMRQSTPTERRARRRTLATRIGRGAAQAAGRWSLPGIRSALKKDVHALRVCLLADGWSPELLPLRRSQAGDDRAWCAHLRRWSAAIEFSA